MAITDARYTGVGIVPVWTILESLIAANDYFYLTQLTITGNNGENLPGRDITHGDFLPGLSISASIEALKFEFDILGRLLLCADRILLFLDDEVAEAGQISIYNKCSYYFTKLSEYIFIGVTSTPRRSISCYGISK